MLVKVIASTGKEELAVVYILELDNGKLIECVESVQPPLPRQEKWVLLVSTLFGCPVGCKMCDAGGYYQGKLTVEEILSQIDFLVRKHFFNGIIPCKQFKIQFARMGEPALNSAVLDVLAELPHLYQAPGLMPSISTIAPANCEDFFDRLLKIKQQFYDNGRFQLQFSLHTTDEELRHSIIPVRKWSFAKMSEYGEKFFSPGDRKITLNFALARNAPLDAGILRQYFSPEKFLIKITPVNPTYRAVENHMASHINVQNICTGDQMIETLRAQGYDVIISIGNVEENQIGSNCGQYLRTHLNVRDKMGDGYTYPLVSQSQDPRCMNQ
jgi:23S rRNA (adenine2503-C2)-methyltransferase